MIVSRHLRFSLLTMLAAFLSFGCASPKSGGPVLTIQFPTSASTNSANKSDVSTLSFDWANVCYIVNVTGPGIAESRSNACEIPTGIFKGSVAPGGTMELEVPRGANRRLEVFIYRRLASGDACPTLNDRFGTTDRSKVSRVAIVENILVDGDRAVNVSVKEPTASDSLLAQFSLAASCLPSAPFGSLKKITQGHAVQSGTSLKVEGSVSSAPSEFVMSGSTLKIRANTRGN